MNDLPDNITKPGLQIAVDLGAPIKVELEGIEIPLHSSIIGLEHEQYIIIKVPEPFPRIEHRLFKGAQLIVRYLAHGTVYAFQTKILEMISKPLALLFIEFPRIIQHHDLREEKRFNCHIPARVIYEDKENLGWILDLALNGCRCLIPASKNPDLIRCELEKSLLVRCVLPGSMEPIAMNGTIKNLKRTRKEVDLGINFATLPADNKKLLTWFLSAIDGISLH